MDYFKNGEFIKTGLMEEATAGYFTARIVSRLITKLPFFNNGSTVYSTKTILTADGNAVRSLANELNFAEAPARHMAEQVRYVPVHVLSEAILYGERMPDPQRAVGAIKIVENMYRGKLVNKRWVYEEYKLEIIYREGDKTILHFVYR